MLTQLKIKNIGIIDDIQILFKDGLNVLTGETGAGKSIMIKAFSMLLGDKIKPQEMVRNGEEQAVVSCLINLPRDHQAIELLKSSGIDDNEGELLIKREIFFSNGRSRAFVNNEPVTLSLLKNLGKMLVDIHSTFAHQKILNPLTHIDYLDKFIKTPDLDGYSEIYKQWCNIRKQIDEIKNKQQQLKEREEFLRFQLEELKYVEKVDVSEEDLENEYNILTKSTEIRDYCSEINNIIYSGSPNLVKKIKNIAEILKKLQEYDSSFKDPEEEISSFIVSLNETIAQADNFQNSFSYSPQKVSELENLLTKIRKDNIKYGKDLEELKEYYKDLKNQLKLVNNEDNIYDLEEKEASIKKQMDTLAGSLREYRKKGAKKFSAEVMKYLKDLGMDKASLIVDIKSSEGPDIKGYDKVEFLLATNPGEKHKPLVSIASGGELCRIMLAFKTILANTDDIQLLIFDEIDANIGGVTAVAAAKMMQKIAENKQLITITHQPQIASKAEKHFSVIKHQGDESTRTFVKQLNFEERVSEVARMLGGEDITDFVTEHARQMIKK